MADGPTGWGSEPGWEACASGLEQSPVVVNKTVNADLPAISVSYPRPPLLVENTGHVVEVPQPASSNGTLQMGDKTYRLVQWHVHAPSEHVVAGASLRHGGPPRPQVGRGRHDLLDLWPSYVAYVTSFMTIGAMWLLHNAITDHLARADTVMLRIDLPLLLFVAFLPFPSKLLGESINIPEEARTVAPFYGLTLLIIGLLVWLLWAYCERAGLLRDDTPADVVHMMNRQLRVGVIFYAVAVVVGILIPRLAVLLYLAIAVFVMIPRSSCSLMAAVLARVLPDDLQLGHARNPDFSVRIDYRVAHDLALDETANALELALGADEIEITGSFDELRAWWSSRVGDQDTHDLEKAIRSITARRSARSPRRAYTVAMSSSRRSALIAMAAAEPAPAAVMTCARASAALPARS